MHLNIAESFAVDGVFAESCPSVTCHMVPSARKRSHMMRDPMFWVNSSDSILLSPHDTQSHFDQ